MGSVGYCMGGRHAQVAAVNYPDYFKASASLHGTYLISDSRTHRIASSLACAVSTTAASPRPTTTRHPR